MQRDATEIRRGVALRHLLTIKWGYRPTHGGRSPAGTLPYPTRQGPGGLRVCDELGIDMQRKTEMEEIRRDIADVVSKLDRLIEAREEGGG